MLRLFIPTWRFFDDVGHVPMLFVRVSEETEWQLALPPLQRHWYTLFLNPAGNERHALNNLLTRLMVETQEVKDIEPTVTYQLVKNLAQSRAHSTNTFQFKLCIHNGNLHHAEDLLVSPIYRVQ